MPAARTARQARGGKGAPQSFVGSSISPETREPPLVLLKCEPRGRGPSGLRTASSVSLPCPRSWVRLGGAAVEAVDQPDYSAPRARMLQPIEHVTALDPLDADASMSILFVERASRWERKTLISSRQNKSACHHLRKKIGTPAVTHDLLHSKDLVCIWRGDKHVADTYVRVRPPPNRPSPRDLDERGALNPEECFRHKSPGAVEQSLPNELLSSASLRREVARRTSSRALGPWMTVVLRSHSALEGEQPAISVAPGHAVAPRRCPPFAAAVVRGILHMMMVWSL